jgi:hypothetical protein
MNCDAARLALEAQPDSPDPVLAAHLAACADCTSYRAELVELDRRLRAALQVPVPPAALQPHVAVGTARPRWTMPLALAASVGAVALLVGLLWSVWPRAALATDVVAHMVHEPEAWSTSEPLPEQRVAAVLARRGVALREGALAVTYVETCWFRGRRVPHLVVVGDGGPVTVMVLAGESIAARQAFDEQGYRGVLVPSGRGALAVLARDGDRVDVDAVARRAMASLEY